MCVISWGRLFVSRLYLPAIEKDTKSNPDPFLAFVQCRNQNTQSSQDLLDDSAANLFQQFDDLAETLMYRREVAFLLSFLKIAVG